jgi:hypothetical protein
LRKIERGIWIIEKTSIGYKRERERQPTQEEHKLQRQERIVDLLFGDGGR